MKKNNIIIIRGKAIFSNTRKPVNANAKYHAGEYKIQIYDTAMKPQDAGTEIGKLVTGKIKDFQLIDGARYDNMFSCYSKNYPFKLVDATGATGTSDDYKNIENGQEVALAIATYENRYGKNLTVKAIKVKDLAELEPESLAEMFEEEDDFVGVPEGQDVELPFN